jgi:hypothetical protein
MGLVPAVPAQLTREKTGKKPSAAGSSNGESSFVGTAKEGAKGLSCWLLADVIHRILHTYTSMDRIPSIVAGEAWLETIFRAHLI